MALWKGRTSPWYTLKDAFLLGFSSRIKTDISEIVIVCLLFTVAVKSRIIIPLQN